MANLDFYALADDARDLIDFLFRETDIVIYELASQFDKDARRFCSIDDLESSFRLGDHPAVYLQLSSRSVMRAPVFRRIELAEGTGHRFRYAVEGAGLIQLYLDGRDGLGISHFGHWNEAGARQRSMHSDDHCDWAALRRVSGRIQRYIRRRAVAKLHSRPVLPGAFSALTQGSALRFGAQKHEVGSEDLKRVAA
jgi:hypothetical protein